MVNFRPLLFTDARLVIPDRVVARVVDGTTVLLNIETGRSFTLDDIGTRVWTLLTLSQSIQDAYDTLLAEYAVEPEQLRRDLEALIGNLAAQELLEVRRD